MKKLITIVFLSVLSCFVWGSNIVITNLAEICDDNNTPWDPSDDIYTITFQAENTATTSGTYVIEFSSGNSDGPFNYGETYSYSIVGISTGATEQWTLVDTDDPSCTETITLGPFVSCSSNFFINSITTCEGFAEVCVEPFTQEVQVYEWVIPTQDGTIIFTEIDTLDNCIQLFNLAPGSYEIWVFMYDWNGDLILHNGPNGNVQENLIGFVEVLDGFGFIDIYSNAVDLCPFNEGNTGCEKVCENSTVNYYVDNITSPDLSYQWSVIGAESWNDNGNGIEVNWGSAGTGQVYVFAVDWNGCETEAEICVEIIPSPEAEFSTTPSGNGSTLNICQGQEVQFDNTSEGAIFYEWSFGDGEFSTDANPSHQYNFPGNYEVELIAKNECLCADTTRLDIIVEEAISPFVQCVGTICELDTFVYNTDADCTQFFWTVSSNGTIISGGGVADNFISIDWQSGPVGNIELTVDGCNGDYCLEPAMVQVPIISGDAKIEGPNNVCKGNTETYTIQDYNSTYYTWSVSSGQIISGQGTNEVVVRWSSSTNLPNMAQISVDYENCYFECSGSDQMDVLIVDEFLGIGPIEVCPQDVVEYTTFEVSGTGKAMSNWELKDETGTVLWSFANAETVNVPMPNNPGMYMLVITATNPDDYCNDFVEKVVKVIEKPDTPTGITGEMAICPGSSYQYQASSTYAESEFAWEVNNGGVIEEHFGNPISITWANSGPYAIDVSQKLLDQIPCFSDQYSISLNPIAQVALVGNDEVCDQEIHTYTADFIENARYVWEIIPSDMGTITGDPEKNEIDIQWTKSGNATVNVSLCGLTESVSVTVFALPQPTVNGPKELCANETGSYSVSSVYTSYNWFDENNNPVSILDNPDLSPGSYELVVTDDNGCTGNTYFTVETLPIPNIRASTPDATGICLANNDPFPTLYALNSDVGYSWQWYMDGVLMIGQTSETLDVKAVGNYSVEVTASNGCKNISNTVVVFDWCDPANGGTCNGGNCNLDYCDNPNGTLDFDFVQGAQCNEWNFTNLSVNYEPGSLQWNFGDEAVANDVSTLDNPSYTFSNAGFYHVLLVGKVEDGDNLGSYCSIWRSKVVTVLAAANFDLDTACPGEETQFYDNSTFIPGEDIISWTWDFGDPSSGIDNTSSLQDPTHVYNDFGNYTVTLEIATATCISIYTKEISVYPKPVIDILPPDVNCANTSIKFEGLSTNHITDWEWDFGDPASGDQNVAFVQEAYHLYESPGSYTVGLTAYNVYGCSEYYSININIEANGLNGEINSDNDNPMCDGETAMLTAPSGGVSWEWSTGATTEFINISTADVYTVTITDVNGCQYIPLDYVQRLLPKPSSVIRGVTVDDYGLALQYHYGTQSVCEGDDVYLEVIEVDGYTYSWSSNETSSQIEFTFDRGNLLDVGTHQFTVELTDTATGCSNEIGPFEVIVHPVPSDVTISSVPGGYICAGESATLSVNSPNADYTYIWNNGQSGESINVEMAGDYFVVATNQFGCQAESNTITIDEGPDIGIIPDGCFERCGPDTLCLPVLSGSYDFQWYFNGVIVPAPEGTVADFIIEESGSYYVELTDAFGCVNASEEFVVNLVDPTGNISGLVYYDVNENGILDGPDTLMQNVNVYIEDPMNGDLDSLLTDINGEVLWEDIASQLYNFSLDLSSLPTGVKPYEDQIDLELIGCDDEDTFTFLCYPECEVLTSEIEMEFCNGNNVYEGVSFSNDTIFTIAYNIDVDCDSLVTVNAIVYNEIEFDLNTSTICFAANDGQISVSNAQGGKGDLEYSIDGVNYSSDLDFDNLVSDTYTIYVRDELMCVVEKQIVIDQYDALEESVYLEYCYGNHDFNGVAINSDTSFVQVLTSVNGCDSVINVTATVYPELIFNLSTEKSCYNAASGEIVIDDAFGGKGTLLLKMNGQEIDPSELSNLSADTYSLTLEDELACSVSVELVVEEIGPIQYTVDAPILECDEKDDQIKLNIVSPDVSVVWEDSSTGNDLVVDEIGNYQVILSNVCESITEDVFVVAQTLEEEGIYIPNIFSPNNDGNNDEFQVFTDPAAEFVDAELHILDRWGEMIYKTNDPKAPWSGMWKNKELQPGVYVVMLKASLDYCHEIRTHETHSSLTIVK